MGEKARRQNGWQKTYKVLQGAQKWDQPQPAAFEKLVAEMGLTEEAAADDPTARRWIKANYLRHFVPEPILMYLGLQVRDIELGYIDYSAIRNRSQIARPHRYGGFGGTQQDSV